MKLKENVDLKMLEEFGFKQVISVEDKIIMIKDTTDNKCSIFQHYRIGVDNTTRIFRKTKFRGGGKCLLSVSVTKNDLKDLIEKGLVE